MVLTCILNGRGNESRRKNDTKEPRIKWEDTNRKNRPAERENNNRDENNL